MSSSVEPLNVQVNDILQIKALDDRDSRVCQSRVEDIVGDCIVIAWPLDRGVLISIPLDRPISMSFVHEDAAYSFVGIVRERRREPIPLLKVRPLGPPERTQRREFFRAKVSLKVTLEGMIGRSGRPDEMLRLKAHAQDLSGGGMRLSAEASIPNGAILTAKLALLDELPHLEVMARVIDSTPGVNPDSKERYQIRMAFHEIKEADRRRIIRYLLHIQRSQASRLAKATPPGRKSR